MEEQKEPPIIYRPGFGTIPAREELRDTPTTSEIETTLEREKALYLYLNALDRGDFEQIERILKQAETDPALEKMIVETHEVIAEEETLPELTAEERAFVLGTLADVKSKASKESNT